MKINPIYKVRKVATTNLVVCQGKLGADMTRVIELNATSVALWKAFENKDFSVEDVSSYLMTTYKIDQALADKDACKWIDALKGCSVIVD